MPMAPPRICPCGYRIAAGEPCPCERGRARDRRREYDATRPNARKRGYTREWEIASKAFLAEPQNRFCACGCGRRADVVDHKIAHRGNMQIFWDRSNWQAMAFGCNSRKAVKSEGALGRGRSRTLRKSTGPNGGPSREIFPNSGEKTC